MLEQLRPVRIGYALKSQLPLALFLSVRDAEVGGSSPLDPTSSILQLSWPLPTTHSARRGKD